LKTDVSSTAGLKAEVTKLTEANATLTTEATSLKVNALTGETALKGAQDEALRLYNLSKGDGADADMQKVISEASYSNAITFQKQFAAAADDDLSLSCSDCNSTNISRASASAGAEGDDEKDESEVITNKTEAEVLAASRKRKATKASFTEDEVS